MLVNVYVDGFNLYYGCLKGTPHKWLDLEALSRRLVPGDEIHRIRYFTAHISPRADDRHRHNRQQYYLRALGTIPCLHIHLGRFQETITRMPLADPGPHGPRTVEVIKTEEKGSDVNLATHLLADAFRGDFETALVITNDADLGEPIRLVRHELGLTIGVASPHPPHRRSGALKPAAPTFLPSDPPEHAAGMPVPRHGPRPARMGAAPREVVRE